MRSITPHGWTTIERAMNGAPLGDVKESWFWAMEQGDDYKLTAYLLLGFCGGSEAEGFIGFDEVHTNAHPTSIAWNLDSGIRTMLAEFVRNPTACMTG